MGIKPDCPFWTLYRIKQSLCRFWNLPSFAQRLERLTKGRPNGNKPMAPPLKPRQLLSRGRDRRLGRLHRQIRRVLLAANGGLVTTADFVAAAYPRLDISKPVNRWYWRQVRDSAERFATRLSPRSRPLLWRAKP